MKLTNILGSDGRPAIIGGNPVNPADYPFRVKQTDHSILAWCTTKDEADQDCADKNSRAESMGIKARYEVVGL